MVGMLFLARTLDQIAALFAFTSIPRGKGVQDLQRVVHSHELIDAALRGKDAGEIGLGLRGHFENSYDQFLNSGCEICDSFSESLKGKSA